MKQIIDSISRWWRGKFVPATLDHILEENVEGVAHIKRPKLAEILAALRGFIFREWKWIIGFLTTLVALLIAYLKL